MKKSFMKMEEKEDEKPLILSLFIRLDSLRIGLSIYFYILTYIIVVFINQLRIITISVTPALS